MNEEKKLAVVKIGDDINTFDRIFCSGKAIGDSDKATTLIYGYRSVDHFIQDYVNILCSAYQFLEKESNGERKEVLDFLKETTADIFDSIESGEFVERISETSETSN